MGKDAKKIKFATWRNNKPVQVSMDSIADCDRKPAIDGTPMFLAKNGDGNPTDQTVRGVAIGSCILLVAL